MPYLSPQHGFHCSLLYFIFTSTQHGRLDCEHFTGPRSHSKLSRSRRDSNLALSDQSLKLYTQYNTGSHSNELKIKLPSTRTPHIASASPFQIDSPLPFGVALIILVFSTHRHTYYIMRIFLPVLIFKFCNKLSLLLICINRE